MQKHSSSKLGKMKDAWPTRGKCTCGWEQLDLRPGGARSLPVCLPLRLVLLLQLSFSEGPNQGFWKLLRSYHPHLTSEEKELFSLSQFG